MLKTRLSTVAALIAAALLQACNGGGGGDGGGVVSSRTSFAANTEIAIAERWLGFLADESVTGPGGSNLNTDGDKIDAVAIVVDMVAHEETNLHIAADRLVWAGADLYLVVDESEDGVNWETVDTGNKIVLLHWSAAAGVATFVDVLDGDLVFAVGDRVFFASGTAAPAAGTESNVRVIDAGADPVLALDIPTDDALAKLEGVLIGEDEGLLFFVLDEVFEIRDLNGDGDATDRFVLALLDGTTTGGTLRNTELAVLDEDVPFRALAQGAGDWLVGFLVSEADQGATSLNDPGLFAPAWKPAQCTNPDDTDTSDQVLHYLEFAAWSATPGTDPIRNTGLVGSRRVIAVAGFVGTVSLESDDDCDLNNDGDSTDEVFRWVEFLADPAPILPVKDAALLHAVADLPGGARGVTALENRWVITADEATDGDIDAAAADHVLVGWYSPAGGGPAFTFDHEPGAVTIFVGTDWLAEQPGGTIAPVDLQEEVAGGDTNHDMDDDDRIPTLAEFDGSFTELLFNGVAVAVEDGNAGIVTAGAWMFYRVDEAADARDWSEDGDTFDEVLVRTSLSTGFTAFVDYLPALTRPAVEVDFADPIAAVYLADEVAAAADYNLDGDMLDWVVRYFRF